MNKLKLGFSDAQNNTKMITVDYPKDNIEADKIKTAMDEILSSQVLMGKDNIIDRKIKAYEEKVEKREFEIK